MGEILTTKIFLKGERYVESTPLLSYPVSKRSVLSAFGIHDLLVPKDTINL